MNHSTVCICIGADVHLDEIVLCVVDKSDVNITAGTAHPVGICSRRFSPS